MKLEEAKKKTKLKNIFKITETPAFMTNTLINPEETSAASATEVTEAAMKEIEGLTTPVFDGIGNLGINYRRT